MNDLRKPDINSYGYLGLILSIASAFVYPFLVIQIGAIVCSTIGLLETKKKPNLPKWPSYIGIVIGSVYVVMFVLEQFKIV